MPPYFWSAFKSHKYDDIRNDLFEISHHLVTHKLYELFKKRANKAMKEHTAEVRRIVEGTKEKILSLESPDLIKGRHLDSFPKQNKHLKVALGELRALKKHGSSLIHIPQKWNRSGDEEAEEQGAAEEDERTFQKASQGFRELKKERKERKERKIQFIQIHNTPDVPRTDIYEITGRFETFQELLCHFSGAQVVPAPQLWVKCNNTQELTSGGALWEYRRGTQKIEHDEIYVVSAPRERSEYIVALAEEGDQENPVVLDLPKCGQPGENPQVLHAYLRQRWPSHVVAHAARFSQEDDKEVLIKTFDNSTFEHRSNDLYVKCSRKSVLKTTGPSSSSSGSIHP